MKPGWGHHAVIWTSRQRAALGLLVGAVAIVLLVVALRWGENVPEGSENGGRAGDLLSRIDPNTASCTELAALPMIGEKRAADIVEYRSAAVLEHPDRPAFRNAADLMQVKGVKAATTRALGPYLVFPGIKDDDPAAASQPFTEQNSR